MRRAVPLSPVPPEEAMRLYEFVFQQDDAEMEDVECEVCGQNPCVCSIQEPSPPARRAPRGRASNMLGRLGRRQTTQTAANNLVFDTRRRRTTSAAGARGLTLSSDNYFLNDDEEVDPLTPATAPLTDDETLNRIQDNIEETRNLARASRASVEERAWRFLDEYRREERQPPGRRRSSLFNVFNAENADESRPPTSNETRTSVPSSHNSIATSISSASGYSVFSAMSSRSSASSSRMSLASQSLPGSRHPSVPMLAPVTFRRPTPLPFRNPAVITTNTASASTPDEVPSPRSGSPTEQHSGSVSPATDAISHIHMTEEPAVLSYEKKMEIRKLVKTRLHRYYPDFITKDQFTEINMSVCDRVYAYIKGPEAREAFTAAQQEKWTKVVHHLVSADLVARDLLG